jgi:hypothetical protein
MNVAFAKSLVAEVQGQSFGNFSAGASPRLPEHLK